MRSHGGISPRDFAARQPVCGQQGGFQTYFGRTRTVLFPRRHRLPGGAGQPGLRRLYRRPLLPLLGLLYGALAGAVISCTPLPRSNASGTVPRQPPVAVPAPEPASLPPATPAQIADAERAVRRLPRAGEARLALADLYLRAGEIPEAARELRAAVRLQPNSLPAHRRLAKLYRDSGYLDREYQELEQIAALAPNDWQAALRQGEIALEMGWFDIAQAALERAERAAPAQTQIQIDLASLALLQHDYPGMEAHARNGMRLAPDDPTFPVILSDACRLQGRLPEAERTLNAAIQLTADTRALTRHQARLAHLLLEPGWRPPRTMDAVKAALAALQHEPDDLEARYWLARAQELEGRLAEAEANYALAAKQDLQFESVAFFLGRIYQRSPDPNRSRQGKKMLALYRLAEANALEYASARQAVNKRPKDAKAHLTAAQWDLKVGRLPAAILELRRTLEITPDARPAQRLLAQTLRAVGRTSEAKQLKI